MFRPRQELFIEQKSMKNLLGQLGIEEVNSGTFSGEWHKAGSSPQIESRSPIDNSILGHVAVTDERGYETVVERSVETFKCWREVPAPKRGEILREVGDEIRKHKAELARLLTMEMGKILVEAEGEIQEIVDVIDYAVGLSRQLYGLTMHSERKRHRMYEQWHPLGPVGVITAFNFPAAVWGWNAIIGSVCGDSIVWKGSEVTPLTSVAITKLVSTVTAKHGFAGLLSLVTGDGSSIGRKMAEDKRLPLISATGSCRMGKAVAETVGKRLGRTLLELGGNNAVIVCKSADIELAARAILFGAVGTAGQRCTSTRRVLVDKSVSDRLKGRLIECYKNIQIGDPLDKKNLIGPLVSEKAVEAFNAALLRVPQEGGRIIHGGGLAEGLPSKCYVKPAIAEAHKKMALLQEETFAPLLYIVETAGIEEAIEIQNGVVQGLSSAIFTDSLTEAEKFLSHTGSDCGIANVNIGTSGAEIGGAFGGEKETGGGRESGSDSWKSYMRRQTNTINWSGELPLAQGISFGE
jgi:aldehyde dehydrogenase (NAD+)